MTARVERIRVVGVDAQCFPNILQGTVQIAGRAVSIAAQDVGGGVARLSSDQG